MNSASQSGTTCSLKMQMKHQWRSGKEAETPRVTQSLGTPCLKAAAQALPVSPVASCCTPKICPLTVTKSRVPLAMSAAQNCCTLPALPVHDLNVTFEVCKDSSSLGVAEPAAFSLPEFPVWENVQSLLNKQEGPFAPK